MPTPLRNGACDFEPQFLQHEVDDSRRGDPIATGSAPLCRGDSGMVFDTPSEGASVEGDFRVDIDR